MNAMAKPGTSLPGEVLSYLKYEFYMIKKIWPLKYSQQTILPQRFKRIIQKLDELAEGFNKHYTCPLFLHKPHPCCSEIQFNKK